ncbi:MAG: DEAD/DEAH box helicase family protein [Chloroflexota bacterium]|nr:DEAD/DEAH box helicase family protein [Chloroflexota bacterium]MDE2958473.1 DEAD/DEAH box helicase family protein [Chloroflexota bacterium]
MIQSVNMFELRPYQRDLLRQVQDGLAAEPRARLMLQLPTGGGKTVIAGALLGDWLRDGRKAVWLTHRKELAEQTRRMLTDAGVSAISNVTWRPGDDAPAWAGGAVILMSQTVARRIRERQVWSEFNSNDLLVIDEAHHAAAPGWERAMKQWPGPIVGMTATPWRLSEKEGFDHLFHSLLCGPQTADLQALDTPALCQAQVFIPPPEQRVAGGVVGSIGDYTETGIKQANRHRPDVMTAGALAFWKKHTAERQIIAYAVSVDHAHNLAAVFNEAGVPAAVILGDTNREERDKAIAGFRDGSIKVLVNVIVATEGFDLPDASCIIIARPTMSLALYLQMVGRGLRPKPDGGDCIILDLAANSVTHGLPEDYREWSLEPRGTQKSGEAPVVICPLCEAASHAASHNCRVCGFSFGKDCDRCGRWRARRRWQYETECGDAHQRVCDLCHIDAHIQAHLPVAPPLDELVELYEPEDEMTFPTDIEIDDDLANRLSALFGELLEAERQSVSGADDARRNELRQLIEWRELVLGDNGEQAELFQEHIAALPEEERPDNLIQQGLMIADWVRGLQSELAGWKDELTELERRAVDKEAIYSSVQSKVGYLLRRAAESVELLPDVQVVNNQSDLKVDPLAIQNADGRPERFYIRRNRGDISAECDVYSEKRIVVLKGSTAAKGEIAKGRHNYPNLREQLIADGVLVDAGQIYKFDKDYEFTSATAVHTIVTRYFGDARKNLKDADGVPFGERYQK